MPVAAILVASIRLNFLNVLLHLRYRGPNHIPCSAPLKRGEEMGWFQHGSTIIAFVPPGVRLAPGTQHRRRRCAWASRCSNWRPGRTAWAMSSRPTAVITGTTHGIGTVTS